MEIPPWLLAFGILLVVVGIGSYITKSFTGFPEGFTSDSKAALAACEKTFQNCLNPVSKGGEGKTNAECTASYNTCTGAVNNPSISTASPAPSQGAAASGSSASGAQAANQIQGAGTPGKLDYAALRDLVDQGKTQAYPPELQTFMKQVESAAASQTLLPTQSQLELAQGSGILPSGTPTDASGSTYKPNIQVILPHETPKPTQTGAAVTVPTDKGTGAEKILENAPALASIRSQVRDDLKKTIADEMANIRNNYELVLVPEQQ